MRIEVVSATAGISMGGAPMSRMLEIRVGETIYISQAILYRPGTEIIFLGFRHEGKDEVFTHIPYEEDAFCFLVQEFVGKPGTGLFVLIDGERHAVDAAQVRKIEIAPTVEPVWCPVANMVAERPYGPGGKEIRRGSKHFAPGAKLYCYPALWGDGYEQIQVLGRHRASHRYVKMVIHSSWLINWRAELVYSPHLIRELSPTWEGTERAKKQAQEIVDFMNQRVQEREQARSKDSGE